MSRESNIDKIEVFLNNQDTDKLIINQINDDIGQFYLYVIRHFSKIKDIKLKIDREKASSSSVIDLFGTKEVELLNLTNNKKIKEQINKEKKIVIFTDYKNYKSFINHAQTINGYDYEKDIIYFIQNKLNINDDNLIRYCLSMPPLTYSETSKFLNNNEGYAKDKSIEEEKNFILEIRKEIFKIKRVGSNIKQSYLMHKNEVKYKKFNFLTY